MSDPIASLSTTECLELFRVMQVETQRLADQASGTEARKAFERLSMCWKALADGMSESTR